MDSYQLLRTNLEQKVNISDEEMNALYPFFSVDSLYVHCLLFGHHARESEQSQGKVVVRWYTSPFD